MNIFINIGGKISFLFFLIRMEKGDTISALITRPEQADNDLVDTFSVGVEDSVAFPDTLVNAIRDAQILDYAMSWVAKSTDCWILHVPNDKRVPQGEYQPIYIGVQSIAGGPSRETVVYAQPSGKWKCAATSPLTLYNSLSDVIKDVRKFARTTFVSTGLTGSCVADTMPLTITSFQWVGERFLTDSRQLNPSAVDKQLMYRNRKAIEMYSQVSSDEMYPRLLPVAYDQPHIRMWQYVLHPVKAVGSGKDGGPSDNNGYICGFHVLTSVYFLLRKNELWAKCSYSIEDVMQCIPPCA